MSGLCSKCERLSSLRRLWNANESDGVCHDNFVGDTDVIAEANVAGGASAEAARCGDLHPLPAVDLLIHSNCNRSSGGRDHVRSIAGAVAALWIIDEHIVV